MSERKNWKKVKWIKLADKDVKFRLLPPKNELELMRRRRTAVAECIMCEMGIPIKKVYYR